MKKKNGRPTAYKEEYNEQAYKLCLLGAIDAEMADIFGVSEQTLNAWKHKYPEFLESLREGKEIADANVANKLYERATGYAVSEEREINGEAVILKKEIPPDTTAAIFWLKNRRSGKWSDKQAVEHSGEVGFKGILADIDSGGLPQR